MEQIKSLAGVVALCAAAACAGSVQALAARNADDKASGPRIINIVNFIRQTDYRLENADSLMFDAVEHQIKLSNKYNFPTTFLFQYDSLINPAYQELMKTQLADNCELGAWWEIPGRMWRLPELNGAASIRGYPLPT